MNYLRLKNHTFLQLKMAGKIGAALIMGAAISNEARGQIVNADQLRNPVVNDLLLINTTGGSNVNSGDIQILSGFATGTGNSGNVLVGCNTGAIGGDLSLGGGFSSTAIEGGDVIVFSGGSGAAGGRSGSILMNRPANSNGQITMGLDDPTAPTIPFAPGYIRPKLAVSSGNIAHVESGTFGLQGTEDIWATLGGPSGIPSLEGNYGLRLNSGLQSANIFLNGTGNDKNLLITVSDDNGDASDILFGARNSNDSPGEPRELMRIANNGNVGIGTSSPSNRLTVNSGASIGSSFVNTTAPSNGLIVEGSVGIGNSNPPFKLYVQENNASFSAVGVDATNTPVGMIVTNDGGDLGIGSAVFGSESNIGISGQSSAITQSIGVEGIASMASGNYGVVGLANSGLTSLEGNFGVYGEVSGTSSSSSTNYAVFGNAAGSLTKNTNGGPSTGVNSYWAGYFNGRIATSSTVIFSDSKFKTNISSELNTLDKILRLNPSTYMFDPDGQYSQMAFDRKNLQHGFIAQQLQEVFPELVHKATFPAIVDSNGNTVKEKVEYLGVNYTGLISVLVASIKEQQVLIEKQSEELAILKEAMTLKSDVKTDLENQSFVDKVFLKQNRPNPFQDATTIEYGLPDNYQSARLWVSNLNGQLVSEILLNNSGRVSIDHSNLQGKGIYIYSLIIDNNVVAFKRMILE